MTFRGDSCAESISRLLLALMFDACGVVGSLFDRNCGGLDKAPGLLKLDGLDSGDGRPSDWKLDGLLSP